MKRPFLITLILINSFLSIQAQIVIIPDSSFKAALIAEGVDKNKDKQIQVSEAQAVTKLSLENYIQYGMFSEPSGYNINSLSGIEAFSNLTILRCNYNKITSLDVSSNKKLTELYCGQNKISNLNVNGLTKLSLLDCNPSFLYDSNRNTISNLDVSTNKSLKTLRCSDNGIKNLILNGADSLTFLDCSKNLELKNIKLFSSSINSLLITNCSSLDTLDLRETKTTPIITFGGNTSLRYIDISNSTAFSTFTLAPGAYNVAGLKINSNGNLGLKSLIIKDITTPIELELEGAIVSLRTLNFSGTKNIVNLDLSKLVALEELNCSNTGLSTIFDLTKNTKLKTLNCSYNNLTKLDLSQMPAALSILNCSNNKISNLNALKTITDLDCSNNQMFSASTSSAIGLTRFICNANYLSALDLSLNDNLTTLNCSSNPLLSQICINTSILNKIIATPQNWVKEQAASWSLACGTVTGYQENEIIEKIKVYPNPAHDMLNISISKPSTDYNIKIADNTGKTVYTSAMTSNNLQINLSQFITKGLYVIQILDNTNKVLDVRKLVLE
jgi:Leucine-rich repeat (LRR) protein